MRPARKFKGFTLVEMIVTVAVLAILLTAGIPAFQSTLDKRRLTGAVEQLYSDLQFARSEAIRQNKRVTVYFTSTSAWCYGMDVEPSSDCDCNSAPGNCTVGGVQKVVSGTDFRNVTLSNNTFASNNVTFDPRRGTANQGRVSLQSSAIGTVEVIVSNPGRVRICSTNVPDYKPSSGSC
jgi:prepilin-type N-terminal cleavage/methylation domain-containing protein